MHNTFTWFSDSRDWAPWETGLLWVTRTEWKGCSWQSKKEHSYELAGGIGKQKRKPPHGLEKSSTGAKKNRMKSEQER